MLPSPARIVVGGVLNHGMSHQLRSDRMKTAISLFSALLMAGWLVGCAAEESTTPAPTPTPTATEPGGSMTTAPGAEGGATDAGGEAASGSTEGGTTETP
jgi:hypothetical protein